MSGEDSEVRPVAEEGSSGGSGSPSPGDTLPWNLGKTQRSRRSGGGPGGNGGVLDPAERAVVRIAGESGPGRGSGPRDAGEGLPGGYPGEAAAGATCRPRGAGRTRLLCPRGPATPRRPLPTCPRTLLGYRVGSVSGGHSAESRGAGRGWVGAQGGCSRGAAAAPGTGWGAWGRCGTRTRGRLSGLAWPAGRPASPCAPYPQGRQRAAGAPPRLPRSRTPLGWPLASATSPHWCARPRRGGPPRSFPRALGLARALRLLRGASRPSPVSRWQD